MALVRFPKTERLKNKTIKLDSRVRESKLSPAQIANILKEFDLGKIVEEIIRNQSVSSSTLYK